MGADDPALVEAVRASWEALSRTPGRFPPTGIPVTVETAAASGLCPAGWAGIVTIAGATLATAPNAEQARALRSALAGLPVAAHTDPVAIGAALGMDDVLRVDDVQGPIDVLGPHDVLGPATLAYLAPAALRVPRSGPVVQQVAAKHPALLGLLDQGSSAEADESGLAEITSAAWVVTRGDAVLAAAGYERWPSAVAHLCVLTAAPARGQGLARVVAAAAVASAQAEGLLPQWRARPAASRRVARALGFVELGRQLSLRLPGVPRPPD